MRHLSPRRQAQLPTEQQFREELFADCFWRCEWCDSMTTLQQHEVARGANRVKARTCRFAVLALCDGCHRSLHRIASDDAVALGLAIIFARRREDFDLDAYHKLTSRRWPDQKQVDEWEKRLSVGVQR